MSPPSSPAPRPPEYGAFSFDMIARENFAADDLRHFSEQEKDELFELRRAYRAAQKMIQNMRIPKWKRDAGKALMSLGHGILWGLAFAFVLICFGKATTNFAEAFVVWFLPLILLGTGGLHYGERLGGSPPET